MSCFPNSRKQFRQDLFLMYRTPQPCT